MISYQWIRSWCYSSFFNISIFINYAAGTQFIYGVCFRFYFNYFRSKQGLLFRCLIFCSYCSTFLRKHCNYTRNNITHFCLGMRSWGWVFWRSYCKGTMSFSNLFDDIMLVKKVRVMYNLNTSKKGLHCFDRLRGIINSNFAYNFCQ